MSLRVEMDRQKRNNLVLTGAILALTAACSEPVEEPPRLRWYVYDERSGAFAEAASACTAGAGGRYLIELAPLPADADQQREQLVRRLAAGDRDIDIIGMDVIWTAEFAEAGWILPWPGASAGKARAGRLASAVRSASYGQQLWAVPFTTNAQLLWYRADRIDSPPETWDEMIDEAEALGDVGTIEAQGERYEGLTVFFASLLASAGGAVLDDHGRSAALDRKGTRRALEIMHRLATSPASERALDTAREDQARLAFESGRASFMLNYTYVWPSARANAPGVASRMGWARWPAVVAGRPSRVTLGGINLAVGAHSPHPDLAFEAAACIASADNQRLAATRGGLPPTITALYDDAGVREALPFADVLRDTLRDAVQRPQTPLYSDVSMAISRTLHPLRALDPEKDTDRLREAVQRALRSEGLL
jgi:multiple sugar transport system substrate-binding protein